MGSKGHEPTSAHKGAPALSAICWYTYAVREEYRLFGTNVLLLHRARDVGCCKYVPAHSPSGSERGQMSYSDLYAKGLSVYIPQ